MKKRKTRDIVAPPPPLLLLFKTRFEDILKKIKEASKNHDTKIKTTYSFVPELLGLPKESNHDAPRRRKNNRRCKDVTKLFIFHSSNNNIVRIMLSGVKKKRKKDKERKKKISKRKT